MAKAGLIENIRDNLRERRESETLKQLDTADHRLIQNFKQVGAEKDVGLTLDAFGALLQDTQKHHINDQEVGRSVATALIEWEGATKTYALIQDPKKYKSIIIDHMIPKKSIKERPKDQVRMFLTSHMARVRNERKGIQRDARMGLLNHLSTTLRSAERTYEKLQDQAMGVEQEKPKSKSKEVEM